MAGQQHQPAPGPASGPAPNTVPNGGVNGAADRGVGSESTSESAKGPAARTESDQGPAAAETSAATEAAVRELEDRWRRALADLANLRKRYARELQRERAAERARAAAAWLPVLDNLDRALDHAGSDPEALLVGVRAVRDQAVALLAQLGYPRQAEVGVPFDPTRHEVVSVVDDPEAPPGTVVEVVRPGYGEAERQLRPVAVAVNLQRE